MPATTATQCWKETVTSAIVTPCLWIAACVASASADDALSPTPSAFDRPFSIPRMTPPRTDDQPFEYVDVGGRIPNYTPGQRWGTQGDPFTRMQRPLSPDESIKHMVTPEGFHVELFASEADFGGGKPICMTWDERGRLWVALTVDYPNELRPPGRGRDRIVICEDTDNDYRADNVTVFVEKLSIPTSIAFHRGGAIVQNATETLYLKDTDGDDRADERRVLFNGWAMNDTHGGVSNFQYGLDNWVWAMQGYNASRPVASGRAYQGFRQGFFRFRPDGTAMEFLRSTNNNTWGLGLSEEGIVFGSTANRNPSVHMPIANRYYEAVRGWAPSLVLESIADSHRFDPITENVRQVDHHGGYTAGAGHSLYTARRYPQAYWNRTAFVNGPTGHLVGTFVLQRDKSGFRSSSPFNLLASKDEWTAPIMAEVGPDGNVWVIDWYNYIVQHNPTPHGFKTGPGNAYETDLRDKQYGRVYRIVYDDEPPRFTLASADPEKLVETLRHDNLFWRRHAQRLLVERGERDVTAALLRAARDGGVDAIGLNVGVIHALWALHGLGAFDGRHAEATAVATAALKHKSAGVRRNALQVLPHDPKSVAAILAAGVLDDADPQVRLEALLALADQPAQPAVGEAIVGVLTDARHTGDRWISDAATCAAAKNDDAFLIALARRPHGRVSDDVLAVAAIVAEHYARGEPSDSIGDLVGHFIDADPRITARVIEGWAAGWPKDSAFRADGEIERALERVATQLPTAQRAALIRLAIVWGSQTFEQQAAEIASQLLARIENESLSVQQRIDAARDFVVYRATDLDAMEDLLEMVHPRTSPAIASGILRALRASENADVARLVLERLSGLTPAIRSIAISALLGRDAWTRELFDAVDRGTVQLTELSLDQRQSLLEHPDRRIRRRATELLRRTQTLPDADRQRVLDELLPLTSRSGDVAAGREAFVQHCSKCHAHSGFGTHIGPDLTGMAVHPKQQLLAEIIDPSRSVEANFRAYHIATVDGRVLSGLLASESQSAIELFDAEGNRQTVLREDIDRLVATQKSLMPDGFEKQLSSDEIVNLLTFLSQRGRYLPLPLDKVATAVSTRGLFNSENARAERLIFEQWGAITYDDVPFVVIDPQNDRVKNVVLLYGPQGRFPPQMPHSVRLACNVTARAIHLLSGVSGWGFPLGEKGSASLIVRLHYDDTTREDHVLRNGEHFADYIRRVDVPGSTFAFDLRGRQLRYLVIEPHKQLPIREIEFRKGDDDTAPLIVAVTVEPSR